MDDLQPWLDCLVRDPSDAIALAQALAAFDALSKIPSTDEISELPCAIQNLLRCLADGTIAPNMAAAELLTEACSALANADSDNALQLVERLDAYMSDFEDVPVDSEPVASQRCEPPLLNLREDGSRILPGTFDTTPSTSSTVNESLPLEVAPATSSTTEHAARKEPASPVPKPPTFVEIVAVLEAAANRLCAQVGTLELLAGPELQRLVDDLSVSSAEIMRLKDALLECAERDAGQRHYG